MQYTLSALRIYRKIIKLNTFFIDKISHKFQLCLSRSVDLDKHNTYTLLSIPLAQHRQGVFHSEGDTVFISIFFLCCSANAANARPVILKVMRPLSGLNICLQRVTKQNTTETKKNGKRKPLFA